MILWIVDLHFRRRAIERDRETVLRVSSKQSNRSLRYFENPLFKPHGEPLWANQDWIKLAELVLVGPLISILTLYNSSCCLQVFQDLFRAVQANRHGKPTSCPRTMFRSHSLLGPNTGGSWTRYSILKADKGKLTSEVLTPAAPRSLLGRMS